MEKREVASVPVAVFRCVAKQRQHVARLWARDPQDRLEQNERQTPV